MSFHPRNISTALFSLLVAACTDDTTVTGGFGTGSTVTGDSPTTGGGSTGTTVHSPPTSTTELTSSDMTTGDMTGDMDGLVMDESMMIRVYDPEGNPIPTAVATWRRIGFKATSQGAIVIPHARPSDGQDVFVGIVTAPGYTTMSVVAEIPKGRPAARRAVLKPLAEPTPLSIAEGGWAERENVAVWFPPDSIVDMAGLPVEGNVDVSVTPYSATEDDRDAMPAPLVALDPEGLVLNLRSAGMFEVNLTHEGRPVRLREGVNASIELELPDSLAEVVELDEPIKSWSLDTKLGIWTQVGTGYISLRESDKKLVWRAEAPHFSVYNADWEVKQTRCLELKIVDSANKPRAGMPTFLEYDAYKQWSNGPVFTGNDGKVCLAIEKWEMATITIGPDEKVPIAEPVNFYADPFSPPSICPPGSWMSQFGYPFETNEEGVMPGPCKQKVVQVYDNPVCVPGSFFVCDKLSDHGKLPIGVCTDGLTICNETGTAWLECEPANLGMPTDMCNAIIALDDDCDGELDEDGCATQDNSCNPDKVNPPESQPCYTQTAGDLVLEDNGESVPDQQQIDENGFAKHCKPGKQTCITMPGPDQGEFGACEGSVTPIVEDCETTDIDENCDGRPTCDMSTTEAQSFGQSNHHHYATAVEVNAAEDTYVAVTFSGNTNAYDPTLNFDHCHQIAADEDVLLFRVLKGTKVCTNWAHAIGGTGKQRVTDLAGDSGNNVVAGGAFTVQIKADGMDCPALFGDMTKELGFIARYTDLSHCAWRKMIGTPGSTVSITHLVTDKSLSWAIYALGEVTGPLAADGACAALPSAGNSKDTFLAKYKKDGTCLWRIRIASPDPLEHDIPRGLTLNADGTALWIAGSFRSKIQLGNKLHQFPTSTEKAFIAKLALDGSFIDSRTWMDPGVNGSSHTVAGLTSVQGGGVAVVGTFAAAIRFANNDTRLSEGGSDIYTALLGPGLNLTFARNYGSPFIDTVSAVASTVAEDGAPYFVFTGVINGDGINFDGHALDHSHDQDLFVARASGFNGEVKDARVFNDVGGGDQIANAIAIDSTGYMHIVGQIGKGTVKFAGPLDPPNQWSLVNLDTYVDSFFAVLAP